MKAPEITTARGKFRLVRKEPYAISESRILRLPASLILDVGDEYHLYRHDDGSLLFVRNGHGGK